MKTSGSDTISAIATPVGEGAVSVIRVSGVRAISIAEKVFRGARNLSESEGHTIHHGFVVDNAGEVVDEVLALVFRGPKSYTGEDVVEFNCHGGLFVTHRVLEVLLNSGARQAEPGEFTKRAFLNRKLDLSQAEAVADLIAARSERAHAASLAQLEGKLGSRVKTLKSRLMDLCALLELGLDFSEEGLELIDRPEVRDRILGLDRELLEMEETFSVGRAYREGITIALAGEPNAGKSSLFNALLREDRAIVTAVPGTTRDSLKEEIVIDGILFSLVDTAGLRDTDDTIEREGVTRSRSIIGTSDIIIVVVDSTATTDREVALEHFRGLHPSQSLILAYNKVDLTKVKAGFRGEFRSGSQLCSEVMLSAKTGEGIQNLCRWLADSVQKGKSSRDASVYLTNRRHRDAISSARLSLAQGLASLGSGATEEIIAFDIREAAESLAEITGEVSSEEILNHIFARFCIGK